MTKKGDKPFPRLSQLELNRLELDYRRYSRRAKFILTHLFFDLILVVGILSPIGLGNHTALGQLLCYLVLIGIFLAILIHCISIIPTENGIMKQIRKMGPDAFTEFVAKHPNSFAMQQIYRSVRKCERKWWPDITPGSFTVPTKTMSIKSKWSFIGLTILFCGLIMYSPFAMRYWFAAIRRGEPNVCAGGERGVAYLGDLGAISHAEIYLPGVITPSICVHRRLLYVLGYGPKRAYWQLVVYGREHEGKLLVKVPPNRFRTLLTLVPVTDGIYILYSNQNRIIQALKYSDKTNKLTNVKMSELFTPSISQSALKHTEFHLSVDGNELICPNNVRGVDIDPSTATILLATSRKLQVWHHGNEVSWKPAFCEQIEGAGLTKEDAVCVHTRGSFAMGDFLYVLSGKSFYRTGAFMIGEFAVFPRFISGQDEDLIADYVGKPYYSSVPPDN